MYREEITAELQASEECREAARVAIEELQYLRSRRWSELCNAMERSLIERPDDPVAQSATTRALGELARTERMVAEVTVVFAHHSRRVERYGRS